MKLKLERIYQNPADLDGFRILIDRLWPRGISKEQAHLNLWAKEAAPSNELRRWYNHDVARFPEFEQKYLAEIAEKPAPYNSLLATVKEQLRTQDVILLYGAKDRDHNQAVILAKKLSADLKVDLQILK